MKEYPRLFDTPGMVCTVNLQKSNRIYLFDIRNNMMIINVLGGDKLQNTQSRCVRESILTIDHSIGGQNHIVCRHPNSKVVNVLKCYPK